MNGKSITIKNWQIVLVVVLVIAALSAAIAITKFVTINKYSNIDRSSKFGAAIDINRDPRAKTFETHMKEDDKSLNVSANAIFGVPKPGEVINLDIVECKGVLNTDISWDVTVNITFPENTFMKNGVFTCPMSFILGKSRDGNDLVVDGYNYIGKKEEFENKIKESFDNADVLFLPKGTNMEDYIRLNSKDAPYKWTIPEERIDTYNSTEEFFVDISYKITEANQ